MILPPVDLYQWPDTRAANLIGMTMFDFEDDFEDDTYGYDDDVMTWNDLQDFED